jgi:cell division protein FtsB
LQRSKRVLDEKHYDSLRLGDESAKKHDVNLDLRAKVQDLEKEMDILKLQRQDNFREIARLKDLGENRA